VAVVVLAAGLLAGCKSNVGLAARVGNSSISESDVNAYLNPAGVASDAAQQSGSQPPPPRTQILHYMIQERVFEQTLRHVGIRPTAADLAAEHDAAASTLLQTQLAGARLDQELDRQLPRAGIKRSFRSTFLRVQELEYLLIVRRKLTEAAQLVALVHQAKIRVSVSPRYGTWNAQQLGLDNTGAPLPSFVTAQQTPGSS